MRHLRKGKKLRRVAKQRKALLKSLTVSIVSHGRIKTTLAKAKALRPYIEKVITKAKRGDLYNVRRLNDKFDKGTVGLLTKKWAIAFKDRNGGYTRIIKLGHRNSDASFMAFIEFTEKPKDSITSKEKKALVKKSAKRDSVSKAKKLAETASE